MSSPSSASRVSGPSWRTPTVIVVCGCLIAGLAFGVWLLWHLSRSPRVPLDEPLVLPPYDGTIARDYFLGGHTTFADLPAERWIDTMMRET